MQFSQSVARVWGQIGWAAATICLQWWTFIIFISQARYLLATKPLPLYHWVKKKKKKAQPPWVCVLLSARAENLHFLKKEQQKNELGAHRILDRLISHSVRQNSQKLNHFVPFVWVLVGKTSAKTVEGKEQKVNTRNGQLELGDLLWWESSLGKRFGLTRVQSLQNSFFSQWIEIIWSKPAKFKSRRKVFLPSGRFLHPWKCSLISFKRTF